MVSQNDHGPFHNVQPTMRVPEHFISHSHPLGLTEEVRGPASSPEIEHDARSEISPLQCGSVPPNPYYNPANDPFLQPPQTFIPPLEITIRVLKPIEETAEDNAIDGHGCDPPELEEAGEDTAENEQLSSKNKLKK